MRAQPERCPMAARLAGGFLLLVVAWAYRDSLTWIYRGWRENPYYSHGPLVPLITGYLLWRARAALVTTSWRTWWPGLSVAALAAVLTIAGHARDINVAIALGLYFLLHAIVLTATGPETWRAALFPLAFLIFAIPVPQLVIYDLSFPLQLASARLATLLMSLLTGADARATGEIMWLDRQEYVVGVQCSGFKAVIGLILVGLLVAYLTDTERWRKVLLAMLAPPLAVAANVIRLFLILCVGRLWGHDFAVGTFHEISGVIMLAVAIGLLLGAARLVVGPGADVAAAPPPRGDGEPKVAIGWPPLALLGGLTLIIGVVAAVAAPPRLAVPEADLSTIPARLGTWSGTDLPEDPRVKAELGDVALLHRMYVSDEVAAAVQLIVICGRGRRSLHTPQACYRGSGNEILGKDDVGLTVGAERVAMRRLTVGRRGRPIILALYTFTNGRITTPEYRRQQRESFRNTTVIWTQVHFAAEWQGSVAATEAVLQPFIDLAWPEIKKALPYSAP